MIIYYTILYTVGAEFLQYIASTGIDYIHACSSPRADSNTRKKL